MTKQIRFIDSKKASLFTKARLALTEVGKKITYLNTHCEITLDAGQIMFKPLSYFANAIERKNGKDVKMDLSYVKSGDLNFVRQMLEDLGFTTVKNIYQSTGKADIAIPLDDKDNLRLFNKYGQLFEFNRFTMGFRRLNKDGVNAIINKYSEMAR